MSNAISKTVELMKRHPLPASSPIVSRVPAYQEPTRSEIAALSTQQKLALLQMSRRVSNQAIWRELGKKYQAPPFTLSTFRQLRDLGYAELLDGQRYHSLTTKGAQACDLVGRALVAEHKIHSEWIGGNDGPHCSIHCTCGWSAALVRGTGMQAKAARAFSTHINTINAVAELRNALAPREAERG